MRSLALLAGVALLAAIGVVHGLRTDRWSRAAPLSSAVEKLEQVPEKSGDWESQPTPVDERQLEVGQIQGYLGRVYRNRRSGDEVSILLLCGRSGQIAVHTPDICYQAAGFQPDAAPVKCEVPGEDSTTSLWVTTFRKAGPSSETLRIFWAWSTGQTWEASDNPRLAFARSPALYKLYVVHRLSNPKQPLASDPSLDLLRVLLPDLRSSL